MFLVAVGGFEFEIIRIKKRFVAGTMTRTAFATGHSVVVDYSQVWSRIFEERIVDSLWFSLEATSASGKNGQMSCRAAIVAVDYGQEALPRLRIQIIPMTQLDA